MGLSSPTSFRNLQPNRPRGIRANRDQPLFRMRQSGAGPDHGEWEDFLQAPGIERAGSSNRPAQTTSRARYRSAHSQGRADHIHQQRTCDAVRAEPCDRRTVRHSAIHLSVRACRLYSPRREYRRGQVRSGLSTQGEALEPPACKHSGNYIQACSSLPRS